MDEFSPHNSHPRGGATPKHWRGIWRGSCPLIGQSYPSSYPPTLKTKWTPPRQTGRKGGGATPNTAGREGHPALSLVNPTPPLNPHHSYKMDDHWPDGWKRGRGHPGAGLWWGCLHLIGRAVPSNIHYLCFRCSYLNTLLKLGRNGVSCQPAYIYRLHQEPGGLHTPTE
ncbi:hypothetical protein LSTR_LSTR005497 [Laodelphax striatellus]|uniref:Uncharacterized protein n=1 Tax=Laodelphax striatellus TaxID=195883 RepID=A0A482WXW6_LAOST|nr:hypothetical protein LSTR_LSTR005497 [Laodelphax striatellus]